MVLRVVLSWLVSVLFSFVGYVLGIVFGIWLDGYGWSWLYVLFFEELDL